MLLITTECGAYVGNARSMRTYPGRFAAAASTYQVHRTNRSTDKPLFNGHAHGEESKLLDNATTEAPMLIVFNRVLDGLGVVYEAYLYYCWHNGFIA
jgi:hypothetical protein